MHGYDKYCQKRYSIIENYDAIARFVYSEYMKDSASSAWLTFKILAKNIFILSKRIEELFVNDRIQ